MDWSCGQSSRHTAALTAPSIISMRWPKLQARHKGIKLARQGFDAVLEMRQACGRLKPPLRVAALH